MVWQGMAWKFDFSLLKLQIMQNNYQKAVAAYRRYCERDRFTYQEPNTGLSKVGRKYVHLRNANGTLAKYDFLHRRLYP